MVAPSEDNPTLYVEYGIDGVNYTSLLDKLYSFNVKDSGIYKVSQAQLKLYNRAGIFKTLQNNAWLRIRADVRNTTPDILFLGKINVNKTESEEKKEILTVTGRGRLNKLQQDYKTYDYASDISNSTHQWNLLEALRHAFTHPDSTHDSGVGVEATGTITTSLCKQSFDRKTLLDIAQSLCDYEAYTGYDDLSVSTPDVKLFPIGTVLTDPLIIIPSEPLERSYEESIDDTFNHILVWPAKSTYFPSRDYFCELGVAQGFWTGNNGTTVTDETSNVFYGGSSIRIHKSGSSCSATLDLTPLFPQGLDLVAYQILTLYFSNLFQTDALQLLTKNIGNLTVTLTDTNNHTISMQKFGQPVDERCDIECVVGKLDDNTGAFNISTIANQTSSNPEDTWFKPASSSFNWIIKKITVNMISNGTAPSYCRTFVDCLYFTNALTVDPTLNTSLQVSDETSVGKWGRRVLNLDMPELEDYLYITTFANRILQIVKNPTVKLKVTHGAKTWAKVGQVLKVPTIPAYNLPARILNLGVNYGDSTGTYWRIVDLEFDYKSTTKNLRSAFTITPRYQPTTSKEWYKGTLAGLLQYKTW